MLVKATELEGDALDWAVAKCEGLDVEVVVVDGSAQTWFTSDIFPNAKIQGAYVDREGKPRFLMNGKAVGLFGNPINSFSDWGYAGPIMEREKLSPRWSALWDQWEIPHPRNAALGILGPSMPIAAMRCYVASKFGDELDIPDELASHDEPAITRKIRP